MISTDLLECFLAVVDAGGVSKGAERIASCSLPSVIGSSAWKKTSGGA